MSDRDRAANTAIDRIEDITGSDDLNDGWWDDWGAKVVAAIADIADMVSMIAGVLAIVVAFIPVVGTALAGVLLVVAAVAAIVSMIANITLAATGERSWAEAGIAIAGAALSVIGLGGAAKAATGLSRAALKQGMRQGAKKAWCKVGFGTCFTAGTLVRTADGERPIETLRAGDKVWAHDPTTGLDGLHLVTETFARTTTTLYHLTIDGHGRERSSQEGSERRHHERQGCGREGPGRGAQDDPGRLDRVHPEQGPPGRDLDEVRAADQEHRAADHLRERLARAP